MTGNHWKRASLELRAAGFEPETIAAKNTIVTVAGAYTNAHHCNNRVEHISDLLSESIASREGEAA